MARVLHIEDDPHSRRLVEKLLTAAGHQVFDTESGLEGVRLATEIHPDLILVDINVPDLDGYEVTLRVRGIASLKQVPIVAITAEGDRQTCLALGADGYIEKPINARQFAQTVNAFLKGHREEGDDTGEVLLREQSQRIVARLEDQVRALSQANARLEEMARLRREFLRNVSHELATPMTPVVGYLKLLLGEDLGPLTPLQAKCLGSIDRSTRRLRNVVDTLIDVSALETERMNFYSEGYDFADVAARAVDQVAADGAENLEFVARIPATPLQANGDPGKLLRAMVHILDNARKFTPANGVVAVHALTTEDGFALEVLDGGPGIEAEQRERIFEPFYQVDGSPTRRYGGVGLGLAFARKVAEALGGRIVIRDGAGAEVAGHRGAGGTLVRLEVHRGGRR